MFQQRSELFYDNPEQGYEPSGAVCQYWLLRTRHTEVAEMGIVRVDLGPRPR